MFMKDFTRSAFFSPVGTPSTIAPTPLSTGLIAGTLVETAQGWQPIETLRIGDRVQTLDGGLSTVLALQRDWLQAGAGSLLTLPGGALDNCAPLALLPDQHLLLDTLSDALFADDLFVLIPARALLGRLGTRQTEVARPTEVITPMFRDEEVVYANSGTLLHCPGVAEGAGRRPQSSFFTRLDVAAARALLAHRAARMAG